MPKNEGRAIVPTLRGTVAGEAHRPGAAPISASRPVSPQWRQRSAITPSNNAAMTRPRPERAAADGREAVRLGIINYARPGSSSETTYGKNTNIGNQE